MVARVPGGGHVLHPEIRGSDSKRAYDVASGIDKASVDASSTSVADYGRSETRPRHRRDPVSGTCTINSIVTATVALIFARLSSLPALHRRRPVPIFHGGAVRQGGSEGREGSAANPHFHPPTAFRSFI